MPGDAHHAGGCFEPKRARLDAAEVPERDGQADRGVAAHVEIADAIDVERSEPARRIDRRQKDHAHHRHCAPRVADERPADVVIPLAEAVATFADAAAAEVEPSDERFIDNHPRRLADRVGIDHAEPLG